MKLIIDLSKISIVRTLQNVQDSQSYDNEPDPIYIGQNAIISGADFISCSVKNNWSWITDRDIALLRYTLRNNLILKMPLHLGVGQTREDFDKLLKSVLKHSPKICTLVESQDPKRQSIDVTESFDELHLIIQNLKDSNILPSVMIEPKSDFVKDAHRLGLKIIEISTQTLCNEINTPLGEQEAERLKKTLQMAKKFNIFTILSGGINLSNINEIKNFNNIGAVSFGQTFFTRSVYHGITKATEEIKKSLIQ